MEGEAPTPWCTWQMGSVFDSIAMQSSGLLLQTLQIQHGAGGFSYQRDSWGRKGDTGVLKSAYDHRKHFQQDSGLKTVCSVFP